MVSAGYDTVQTDGGELAGATPFEEGVEEDTVKNSSCLCKQELLMQYERRDEALPRLADGVVTSWEAVVPQVEAVVEAKEI